VSSLYTNWRKWSYAEQRRRFLQELNMADPELDGDADELQEKLDLLPAYMTKGRRARILCFAEIAPVLGCVDKQRLSHTDTVANDQWPNKMALVPELRRTSVTSNSHWDFSSLSWKPLLISPLMKQTTEGSESCTGLPLHRPRPPTDTISISDDPNQRPIPM
jgi:hypothetical protein